jgi:hypothetical protein
MWYPAGSASQYDCAHQPGDEGDEGDVLRLRSATGG